MLQVQPGAVFAGHRTLHTLEGALRRKARLEGRFLASGMDSSHDLLHQHYAVTCVLGNRRCPFLVRLLKDTDDTGETTWRCVQVHQQHSCISETDKPGCELLERMAFFVSVSCAALPTDT